MLDFAVEKIDKLRAKMDKLRDEVAQFSKKSISKTAKEFKKLIADVQDMIGPFLKPEE